MCAKLVRCVDPPPGVAADADRHRPRQPDVLHAWAGRHDPDGGEWWLAAPSSRPRRQLHAETLGLNGLFSCGWPISSAIKGNLDRLTEAATGGRDDGGDADVSGDTDRDPEADARERLSRHIVKTGRTHGRPPDPCH